VASAVNPTGQVVGYSLTADSAIHAFSWTTRTGMVDLGAFAADDESYAAAINATGQVVGLSFGSGRTRPYSWTAEGGMVQLEGRFADARAVNAGGQVVGSSDGHAALWLVNARTVPPAADAYVRSGFWASHNFGAEPAVRAKKGVSP